MLQYEKLKKEEIKEASALAARAYFDYIYITLFFPGLKVFHEYEITHNGQTMGNWSLKKLL